MSGGRIRLGAVLAGALVVALALWIFLARDDDEPARPRSAARTAPATLPRLDERGLIRLARSLDTHMYWIGPRAGSAYELTTTPAGRTFVRYLPAGVDAGDPRPNFLTVATYPLGTSALSALRRAAREPGAQRVELPGGALMVTNSASPTSAFFARPGWKFEVEVYHPKAGEAMRIVLTGAVREIR
jgi:hypothetical protein